MSNTEKKFSLTDTEGNPFTITVSISPTIKITALGKNRCGCLHDEIFQYRPDLKPFIELHLCDEDGTPLHSFENGWYWLAKAAEIKERWEPSETKEECFEFFRKHCLIDSGTAALIVSAVHSVSVVESTEKAKEVWRKIHDDLKPLWNLKAEMAKDFFATL